MIVPTTSLGPRALGASTVSYYVDGIDGNDGRDGLTIDTAFATIQHGVDQAKDGDTVVVLPDVYEEDVHFQGKNITLTSVNPEDPAVVDSTCIGGDWPFQQRRESIVQFLGTEDPNCVLQGFRIHGYVSGFDPVQTDCSKRTHATIRYCVFKGNCGLDGTVINYCDGLIKNCVITDNYYCVSMSFMPAIKSHHAWIENCTIVNNQKAVLVKKGGCVTLLNCIVACNPICVEAGARVELFYNDIFRTMCGPMYEEGVVYWGPGNVWADPNFVSPGFRDDRDLLWPGQDYHLQSSAGRWDSATYSWVHDPVTSPCIDAGNPGSPLGEEPAPTGRRINMGAYGGTPTASKSPLSWRPLSDLDNVTGVEMNDFTTFAEFWDKTGEGLPADLDRSGRVDLKDLALFALDWLDGRRAQ